MNFDFPIEITRTERSKSASIEIEDDIVKVVVPKTLSDQRIEAKFPPLNLYLDNH